MSGISFKFNKTANQNSKVDQSKVIKGKDVDENPDFVLSVDNFEINSSKKKEEEKELIIPLIVQNNWRLPAAAKAKTSDKETSSNGNVSQTLEEQAANEIIAQSREFQESREKSYKDENYEIPLILRNKVPEGYETDDKLDVSLRAEPSTLEDYERIPVDKFGVAMLRGMGWKPGMAIGLRNKDIVKPIEVVLRPKGLGLGADRSKALQNAIPQKDEEGNALQLAKGCYVLIREGNNKGLYGQVESIDDDTGRVYIKLALTSKQIHLPELFLQVVNQKEYEKEGKVISNYRPALFTCDKSQYDDAVKERENKTSSHKKKRSKDKKKHRSRSRSPKQRTDESRKSKKKDDSQKMDVDEEEDVKLSWLRPQIKVRFVNEDYKKGKYYNTKVVIEDVLSPTTCICRTTEGKVLEDIHCDMLETVIPRTEPSYIMVVKGNSKGMIGKIIHRDKSRCVATVQLFPDNEVNDFRYDDICEFVGDVSQHD